MIPDKQVKEWRDVALLALEPGPRQDSSRRVFDAIFTPETVLKLLNELDAHHDEMNRIVPEMKQSIDDLNQRLDQHLTEVDT